MKNNESVGNSFVRTDALDKTRGAAKYTDDLAFPNLAYGMILRSPYSHARVKKLDFSEASKVDGFLGYLTPDDVPQKLYNSSGNPPSALIIPDEKILTWEPLFAGDRVAAIVADSKSSCLQILESIRVEYEVLPGTMDVKTAMSKNAPIVHTELQDSNIMKHLVFTEGDVEKGFQEAEFIFEDTFSTQAIHQLYMEPTSCICQYENNGNITIWSPSQTLFQERRILAELLGKRENQIRIIKPQMGGGFGARQQLHSQHIGVLLSQLTGRPVKVLHTREEDIFASSTRHETECTIKMGVNKDGNIKAVHIYNLLNGGPYVTHTPTVAAAAGRKFQYHTENYRYDGISLYTNSPTAGAMRGYGNLQVVFGREVMLDRIARKLNLDPVGMRLKHHLHVGDHFPAADYDILSLDMEQLVQRAEAIKEKIDHFKPLCDNSEIKEAWGVSFSCHSSGPSNRDGMSSAVVMANDDGTFILSIGSADIGQGSETVMAQIAAETLQVPFECISVQAADTGTTPYDTGTFASGQTFVCGNAVKIACENLRKHLRTGLAKFFEKKENEIVEKEGLFIIHTKTGLTQLTTREAVSKIAFGMKGTVIIGQGSYKALGSPPPFAVCYSRARYNKKFNSISITDIIEVVDVGTAINPEQVKAQVHGGVIIGYGFALMENIEFNRHVRKAQSSNLLHYKGPLSSDIPMVYTDIAEGIFEPSGPFGAKSVGELSAVPVAPAIVNSVVRASGREISSLPLSRFFSPPPFHLDKRDPISNNYFQ
ncbi:MAG: molybdopterin-dependent oxidoreductase [Clostridiales bacterium]|nr:molybdopterin-dependent oxidoreductase [Clostridiales bacterium]MDD7433137.1 molybdopterin-dependent oxidoreductase [Clostridiales bacterium]MDY3062014.1 molybdopterin cofactor-binding domain-containing protein [Eubacteriales bacterium]